MGRKLRTQEHTFDSQKKRVKMKQTMTTGKNRTIPTKPGGSKLAENNNNLPEISETAKTAHFFWALTL